MFDLRKIEKKPASGQPFKFTCDGETFEFPAAHRAGWRFLEFYRQRRTSDALRELFKSDPASFDRFVALDLDYEDINALFDAYTEHAGSSQGESEASANS